MKTFVVYILEASVCITIFYLFYLLFLSKDSGFKFIRFYLLTSLIISLILPLNSFSIDIFSEYSLLQVQNSEQKITDITYNEIYSKQTNSSNLYKKAIPIVKPFNYKLLINSIYYVFLILVLTRFLVGLIMILNLYLKSFKTKIKNLHIIKNEQLKCSFSFLNLVFINPKDLTEKEIQGIIAHENIHVLQYHTFDLTLVELISAVMWFNPFIWLLRKSLRQVHEYLADEGVLNIGFDRLEYQVLLINQVAESRLLSLASSFNQSQIKNRIFMMTKLNSNNRTKLKILALVPITAILLFIIACVNGQKKNAKDTTVFLPQMPPASPSPLPFMSPSFPDNYVATVSATKMNILYVGVDNPIDIAVYEYKPEDIKMTIDNGFIRYSKGKYIANPARAGQLAVITVYAKGKKVKEKEFRVKYVPDPVAKIAGIKISGKIEKSKLLAQSEVYAEMENFDFDLNFKIVEFTISTINNGYISEATSLSNNITIDQKKIIEKCQSGHRVYIENIKGVAPDGTFRHLGNISLQVE